MHASAMKNCLQFRNKYLSPCKVLDVGSLDINGSVRPLFSDYDYVGLDRQQGANVDVILTGDRFPFDSGAFGAAVATSCFEHDEAFWMTFNEIIRVTKGYVYINTPSRGNYHGFPGDCWRFQKDAYAALAKWNGKCELVEQYITAGGHWQDNVGIFKT